MSKANCCLRNLIALPADCRDKFSLKLRFTVEQLNADVVIDKHYSVELFHDLGQLWKPVTYKSGQGQPIVNTSLSSLRNSPRPKSEDHKNSWKDDHSNAQLDDKGFLVICSIARRHIG